MGTLNHTSGKESKIHFYEPGGNYGSGGGHVPWAAENVWVDSKKGGAHVLAHERSFTIKELT